VAGGAILLSRSGSSATGTTSPLASATPGATSPLSSAAPSAATSLSTTRLALPATAGVSVDPGEAANVVDALWLVRERALANTDMATIRELETGPALEWDAACYDGCQPTSPRPMQKMQVFVPRQSTYPAYFLAEVLTITNDLTVPYVETMVFTRASTSLPWMLNFDTGYSEIPTMSEQSEVDAQGFDAPAPSFTGVTVSDLPGELAAYWQTWKDTGAAPPGARFEGGTWTNEWGPYIYNYAQELTSEGLSEAATYSADPSQDGQWTFAIDDMVGDQLVDGMALSCGTVRFTSVISALSGYTITQPVDQSTWSDLLPAGTYSQLTRVGLRQSCFLLQPGSASIGVVGGNGGDTKITGIPAGESNTL
jgi:hypothetical protein